MSLASFALWLVYVPTALVGRDAHDYYEASAILRLAPVRRSRSTVIKDVSRVT